MVRNRLERVLASVHRRGDWLGGVAGVVAHDLADDAFLNDLVHGDDEATHALLRASRIPRVRPILVVLAARASGGGEVDPELQYAAELLYAALALHDVALGSPGGKRRTVARSVLRRVGWLGNNRVLLRAMELARHAPTPEVLDDLIETLGAFHDGQDVAARLLDGDVPDVAAWREHADGHTGALFAFCCRAGAHVALCSQGELAAFGRFGRHLGRMWHVAEDVVLLQGDDALDHLAGRALAGRPMLPVAVAVERDPEAARLWQSLVTEHNPEDVAALLDRVHAVGALAGTRAIMAQEHWSARQALLRFESTTYRHALERLASGISRAPYEDRDPELPSY